MQIRITMRPAVCGGLSLLMLIGAACPATAQLVDDRTGPRATPDPRPLPSLLQQALNPKIQVPGDVLFDPADDELTNEQKDQIVRAHLLAWQQVQAALLYLQSNERRILAGQDSFYNNIFGQFYDRSSANPLLGEYDLDVPAAVAENRIIELADVNQNSVQFINDVPYLNNIQIGDHIVIGNQVHVVADLVIDTANVMNQGQQGQGIIGSFKTMDLSQQGGGQGGGGGGGQMQNPFQNVPVPLLQEIILVDPFEDYNGMVNTTMVEVRRVLGLTSVTNSEHYERVVLTFEAIRDLLLLETTYTGDWDQTQAAFNRVFAIVDPATAQPRQGINQGMLPPAFVLDLGGDLWDRSFREYGYSNSPSDLAEAQRFADASDPLHWTEDNALLLQPNGDPEEQDLLFFNQQMTAFGEFDQGGVPGAAGQPAVPGVNSVFVGGGFLNENQNFVGDLFDSSVSNESRRTELLQYQQIIAAFSEFAPDFFARDSAGDPVQVFGAAIGMLDIVREVTGTVNGDGQLPFPQNIEGRSFARFANIFSDPRLGNGIGDGSLLPPAGKSGQARGDNATLIFPFNPLVPIQ